MAAQVSLKNFISLPYPSGETLTKVLTEILRRFDSQGKVKNSSRYYFLSSLYFYKPRIIDFPANPYFHKKNFDGLLSHYTKNKFPDEKAKEEFIQIASDEFKIHLMPKSEYMLISVKLIFEFLSEHPEILKFIHDIKITDTYGMVDREQRPMPQIVIYPMLGRESLFGVLTMIKTLFPNEISSQIGSGVVARFSRQFNPFLCCSNGGADFKYSLTEQDKINYLTESQVHFQECEIDPDEIKQFMDRKEDIQNQSSMNAANINAANEKKKMREQMSFLKKFSKNFAKILEPVPGIISDSFKVEFVTPRYPMHFSFEHEESVVNSNQIKIIKRVFDKAGILYRPRMIKDRNKYYYRVFLPPDVTASLVETFFAQLSQELNKLMAEFARKGVPAVPAPMDMSESNLNNVTEPDLQEVTESISHTPDIPSTMPGPMLVKFAKRSLALPGTEIKKFAEQHATDAAKKPLKRKATDEFQVENREDKSKAAGVDLKTYNDSKPRASRAKGSDAKGSIPNESNANEDNAMRDVDADNSDAKKSEGDWGQTTVVKPRKKPRLG